MKQKIVAVINQKGGVGKTTTSINLASRLAMRNHRVLLIDLDPQAHSTIGLGIEPGDYQFAIHDILLNKIDVQETILKTSIDNLNLIPSHIRLDRTEQLLTPEMFKESRLQKAIAMLDYDFIIIDCRPTLGTLTVNALYACNFIIVPCEMSRYSLEGFSDLMETIHTVKDGKQRDKNSFIRILLTKCDSRKSITNDWVINQLKPYRNMVFKTSIRQNEALNQAHIAMEPIYHFKAKCHGAEDYTQLTEEFLKLCHQ